MRIFLPIIVGTAMTVLTIIIYPTEQHLNLEVDPCAAAEVAGLSLPVGAETASVSAEHGLGLNDDDHIKERRVQTI